MFRIKDEKQRAAVAELFGVTAFVSSYDCKAKLSLSVDGRFIEHPWTAEVELEPIVPEGFHSYPAEKPPRAGVYKVYFTYAGKVLQQDCCFGRKGEWNTCDDIFAWKELEK